MAGPSALAVLISIDKDFKFAAVQRLEPVSILFVSFLPHPS
jgi:hypothetical protein